MARGKRIQFNHEKHERTRKKQSHHEEHEVGNQGKQIYHRVHRGHGGKNGVSVFMRVVHINTLTQCIIFISFMNFMVKKAVLCVLANSQVSPATAG